MVSEKNDNLELWEKVRAVPENALTPITGGRLKGKSDISPLWRFKTLTDMFGVCGFGWRYEVVGKRLEQGANGEIAAFVDIHLFVKMDGEWSAAIPGTGGSSFVANEKNGLYVNDECFKMALTDAIGVACKSLGIAADVYWSKDCTKYSNFDEHCEITPDDIPFQSNSKTDTVKSECEQCQSSMTAAQMTLSKAKFAGRVLCPKCQRGVN